MAEAAVQGGATGALIVDGIERVLPETQGLVQRTLVLRDQLLPPKVEQTRETPAWDISLNGIPILYPGYIAPTLEMTSGRSEIWRAVNTAGGAMFDLQLLYDDIPQPLRIVSLDAVPTNSQNSKRRGTPITLTN